MTAIPPPPPAAGLRLPYLRPWMRLVTHSFTLSLAAHAAIIAALWSGVAEIGARGPGESSISDGLRDDAPAATWDVVEALPPPDDDTPIFEAVESTAVPPPEALDPIEAVDLPPMDLVPIEAEAPVDETPVPTMADARAIDVPFAAGRPIPRTHPTRAATPPPPATAPQLAVAAPRAPTAPAAPSRPPAAAPAGGGFGVRPPVPDPTNRDPVFPAEAYARGERGRVTLLLRLSPDGYVTEATIAQSSGSIALDRAALDAARMWHFRPALRDDGTAIAASVRRGVNFD